MQKWERRVFRVVVITVSVVAAIYVILALVDYLVSGAFA